MEGELKEKDSQLEHLSTQLSSKREPEFNSLLEDVEASQSMQENMDLAKQLEKPMLGWLILNPRWRDFNVIFYLAYLAQSSARCFLARRYHSDSVRGATMIAALCSMACEDSGFMKRTRT